MIFPIVFAFGTLSIGYIISSSMCRVLYGALRLVICCRVYQSMQLLLNEPISSQIILSLKKFSCLNGIDLLHLVVIELWSEAVTFMLLMN